MDEEEVARDVRETGRGDGEVSGAPSSIARVGEAQRPGGTGRLASPRHAPQGSRPSPGLRSAGPPDAVSGVGRNPKITGSLWKCDVLLGLLFWFSFHLSPVVSVCACA